MIVRKLTYLQIFLHRGLGKNIYTHLTLFTSQNMHQKIGKYNESKYFGVLSFVTFISANMDHFNIGSTYISRHSAWPGRK